MDEEYRIGTNAYSLNYAGWCTEKASSLLKDLALMVDIVKDPKVETETKQEELRTLLSSAIYDATKLLCFSCNAKWEHEERDRLMALGSIGFKALCVEYGLDNRRLWEIGEIRDLIQQCRAKLRGERGLNRTALHELLDNEELSNSPGLSEIRDQLEKVTMGEMPWLVFFWKTPNRFLMSSAHDLLRRKKSAKRE